MPGHAAAPFDFEYSSYGTGKEVRLPVAYTASLVALELGILAALWLGSGGGADMALAAQALSVILTIGAVAGILPAVWRQEHSKYLYAPLICLASAALMWYSSGDPSAALPAMAVCVPLLLIYMGYAIHSFFKGDDLGDVEHGEVRKHAFSCAWSIVVVAAQAIAGTPFGLAAAVICSGAIALGTIGLAPDDGVKSRNAKLWPMVVKMFVFVPLFATYALASFSGEPGYDAGAAFYFSAAVCAVAFAASVAVSSHERSCSLDAALFGTNALLFFFNAGADADLLVGMHGVLVASIFALEAGKAAFLAEGAPCEGENGAEDGDEADEKEETVGWRTATNGAVEEKAVGWRTATNAAADAKPAPGCPEREPGACAPDGEAEGACPSKELGAFWTLVGITLVVLAGVLAFNPPEPGAFPAFVPAVSLIAGCIVTAIGVSRAFFAPSSEDEAPAEAGEACEVPFDGEGAGKPAPGDDVAGPGDEETAEGEASPAPAKIRLLAYELVVLSAFALCAVITPASGLPALCLLLGAACAAPFAAACFTDAISPIESVLFAACGCGLAAIAGDGIAARPDLGLQVFVETVALLAALSLVFDAVGQCLKDSAAQGEAPEEAGAAGEPERSEAPAGEDAPEADTEAVAGDGSGEVLGEAPDPVDTRFFEICDGVVRVSVAAAAGLALLSMLGCASDIPELVSAIFQICLPAMFALVMLALAVSAFQAAQKAKRAGWDEGRCADGGSDGESSADSPVEEVPGEGAVEGGGEEPSDARQDGNGFRMLSILGTCSASVACVGAACLLLDGPSVASISMLVLGAAASFISFASFPGFDVAPAEEACPDDAEGAPAEPIAVRDWLEDLAETDSDERGLFRKAAVQHDAATARCDFVLPLAEGNENARKAALSIEERIHANCRIVADSSYVNAAGEPAIYEDAGIEALLDANAELLHQLEEIGKKLVRDQVSQALEESGAVKEEAAQVADDLGKYGF